jgi:hypothetical protein
MLSTAASIRRNPRAVSGLLLWLDAKSIAQEGPLDSWGVASAPSKFSRPIAVLGQYPAVQFDGEYACLTLPQISPGATWKAFIVGSRAGGSTYGTILQLLSGASTQAAMVASNNDATQGPILVSSGSTHVKGGVLATGAKRILTVGPSLVKQNNVSASTSAVSSPITVTGSLSMIGAANSNAPIRFFDGSINEIRLYSSLTASQEASIYAELAEKWGVA